MNVTSSRTGRAFIVSALTAVAGVAVIATSSLPLLRDFGAVVTLEHRGRAPERAHHPAAAARVGRRLQPRLAAASSRLMFSACPASMIEAKREKFGRNRSDPQRGSWSKGRARSRRGSSGRPSTRSPTMLRWISSVPPRIESDGAVRNSVCHGSVRGQRVGAEDARARGSCSRGTCGCRAASARSPRARAARCARCRAPGGS